jgi:hypothetical protein
LFWIATPDGTIELQAKRAFNIAQTQKFMEQKQKIFCRFSIEMKKLSFLYKYPCKIHPLKLKIEFVRPDRTSKQASCVTSAMICSGKIYYIKL